MAVGVPLSVLLLRGLPTAAAATPAAAAAYGLVLLVKGVLTSWAAPACNNPVFAEIVPPDMRNLVYAFDRSFEGEGEGAGGRDRGWGRRGLGWRCGGWKLVREAG